MTATDDLIMIAYDGSDNADRAIDWAGRIWAGRSAVVVTAWETALHQTARMSSMSGMQPMFGTALDSETDQLLRIEAGTLNDRGVERAAGCGLQPRGHLVEVSGTVWGALIDVADEIEADVLVTGTRGATGLRALMRSSVAEQVLKHCSRPVLVVPARCTGPGTPVT